MSDQVVRQNLQEYISVWNTGNWTTVHSDALKPDQEITQCVTRPGRCWIRVKCQVDLSFSFYKLVKRPEFCALHGVKDTLMECQFDQLLAPGDGLTRVRFQGQSRREYNGVITVLQCDEDSDGWHSMRTSQFQDCPNPGEYTSMMVSVGGYGIDHPLCRMNAFYFTLKQGQEEESTEVAWVFSCPWDAYPESFTATCITMFSFIREKAEENKREQPELQELAESFYTILSLRGCSRGSPLLPQGVQHANTTQESIGGFFWQPWEEDTFSFATYLKRLFQMSGCDAGAFDTLYGQQLVPYQAVVLTEDWIRIQDDFKPLFHAQCSAYRFVRGGNGAPKIRTEVEPRLTQNNQHTVEWTGERECRRDKFTVVQEEKNTFVNLRVISAERGSRISSETPFSMTF